MAIAYLAFSCHDRDFSLEMLSVGLTGLTAQMAMTQEVTR